jgi:PhoPQ-activated pathogenicity-related protein
VALPEYEWAFPDEATTVVTSKTKPAVVKLWQATNPEKREFRIDVFGPNWKETILEPEADGTYVGRVALPEKGYTAYLVELTFPGPGVDALILTTPTRVVPDVTEHKFEPKTDWSEGFISGKQKQ